MQHYADRGLKFLQMLKSTTTVTQIFYLHIKLSSPLNFIQMLNLQKLTSMLILMVDFRISWTKTKNYKYWVESELI